MEYPSIPAQRVSWIFPNPPLQRRLTPVSCNLPSGSPEGSGDPRVGMAVRVNYVGG